MNKSELWIAHSEARFPTGYGGRDINGVCVTSVDTFASGCISSYVKNSHNVIDIERYLVLKGSIKSLEKVLPYLEGDAFEYFSRLHEMCRSIVTETKIA